MGCFYTDPTTSKPTFRNNYPDGLAATDAIAFISDDPDQLYIAQQDANDITAVDLGNNAEHGHGSWQYHYGYVKS